MAINTVRPPFPHLLVARLSPGPIVLPARGASPALASPAVPRWLGAVPRTPRYLGIATVHSHGRVHPLRNISACLFQP